MKNKELYPKNNGRKYYLIFQIKKIKNERIYKKINQIIIIIKIDSLNNEQDNINNEIT